MGCQPPPSAGRASTPPNVRLFLVGCSIFVDGDPERCFRSRGCSWRAECADENEWSICPNCPASFGPPARRRSRVIEAVEQVSGFARVELFLVTERRDRESWGGCPPGLGARLMMFLQCPPLVGWSLVHEVVEEGMRMRKVRHNTKVRLLTVGLQDI